MITYHKSFLNIGLIFRVNGSPIFRAFIPAIISTIIFYIVETHFSVNDDYLDHPYGVGVLISSISFIVVFRANYGYQRYWGACGHVHHMTSKWLDAVTHTGVFHMQQSHYDNMKPPSYYDHHDLNYLHLKRDREVEPTNRGRKTALDVSQRAKSHSIEPIEDSFSYPDQSDINEIYASTSTATKSNFLMSKGRLDGGWGMIKGDSAQTDATYFSLSQNEDNWEDSRGFASTKGGRTPTLFLQELIHLASLCNAVAYSTLRNDIEGTTSPLEFYTPGAPWPDPDPDNDDKSMIDRFFDVCRYLSGVDKSEEARVKYNESRPLPVLGGVSKNEIKFLQKARGPSAKVTLAWHWLSEFIIREHLAGSLGKVGPPIISRLIQFLSDGMIYYNHARKTMFIPFPFPHAQISGFFMIVIMIAVPILMDEYSNNIYLGSVLTFLTVASIAGIHEVARELENPFRNAPNEIPLCTLQALFNEALITLYAGYHPDQFWDADDYREAGPQAPEYGQNGLNKPVEKSTEPKIEKPATFGQLQKVVVDQQKEIARLSALIEGKNGKNGTCETL